MRDLSLVALDDELLAEETEPDKACSRSASQASRRARSASSSFVMLPDPPAPPLEALNDALAED